MLKYKNTNTWSSKVSSVGRCSYWEDVTLHRVDFYICTKNNKIFKQGSILSYSKNRDDNKV